MYHLRSVRFTWECYTCIYLTKCISVTNLWEAWPGLLLIRDFLYLVQLKTAMLTLVLVALLIVALSSVDSALSYILALVLKRKTWPLHEKIWIYKMKHANGFVTPWFSRKNETRIYDAWLGRRSVWRLLGAFCVNLRWFVPINYVGLLGISFSETWEIVNHLFFEFKIVWKMLWSLNHKN